MFIVDLVGYGAIKICCYLLRCRGRTKMDIAFTTYWSCAGDMDGAVNLYNMN